MKEKIIYTSALPALLKIIFSGILILSSLYMGYRAYLTDNMLNLALASVPAVLAIAINSFGEPAQIVRKPAIIVREYEIEFPSVGEKFSRKEIKACKLTKDKKLSLYFKDESPVFNFSVTGLDMLPERIINIINIDNADDMKK